jgi:hypothetical protein
VDEARNARLDGSHPVTLPAKMLRLGLLKVKADLERELGRLVLRCSDCGQTVIGSLVSASRRDIGLTVSPLRMARRFSERPQQNWLLKRSRRTMAIALGRTAT